MLRHTQLLQTLEASHASKVRRALCEGCKKTIAVLSPPIWVLSAGEPHHSLWAGSRMSVRSCTVSIQFGGPLQSCPSKLTAWGPPSGACTLAYGYTYAQETLSSLDVKLFFLGGIARTQRKSHQPSALLGRHTSFSGIYLRRRTKQDKIVGGFRLASNSFAALRKLKLWVQEAKRGCQLEQNAVSNPARVLNAQTNQHETMSQG